MSYLVSPRVAPYASTRPGLRWMFIQALLVASYPAELLLRREFGAAYLRKGYAWVSLGLLALFSLVGGSLLLAVLAVSAGFAWRRHRERTKARTHAPGGDSVPPIYPGAPMIGGPVGAVQKVPLHTALYRTWCLGEVVALATVAEVAHYLGDSTATLWLWAGAAGLLARLFALWRRQSEREHLIRESAVLSPDTPLHLPITPPSICPPGPRRMVSIRPTG